MYTQIFFVTSVRGRVFAPQIAANASLSFFGAMMPTPFFFIAAAFFLALSLCAFFPIVRFSALIFFKVALVIVVFVVLVGATVVLVVVVTIAIEGGKCKQALSL